MAHEYQPAAVYTMHMLGAKTYQAVDQATEGLQVTPTKMTVLNLTDTWDPRAKDMDTIVALCALCGGTTTIRLSHIMLRKWEGREANIQDIWPHVNAARREALITGYHDPCFKTLFSEEES
jgi:hypothetical protein